MTEYQRAATGDSGGSSRGFTDNSAPTSTTTTTTLSSTGSIATDTGDTESSITTTPNDSDISRSNSRSVTLTPRDSAAGGTSSSNISLPKLNTNFAPYLATTNNSLSPKLSSLISPSPSTTSINTTFASSVSRNDSRLLHQRSYLSLKQNQQRYLALSPIQLGLGNGEESPASSSDSSLSSPSSTTSPLDQAHTHIPLSLPGRSRYMNSATKRNSRANTRTPAHSGTPSGSSSSFSAIHPPHPDNSNISVNGKQRYSQHQHQHQQPQPQPQHSYISGYNSVSRNNSVSGSSRYTSQIEDQGRDLWQNAIESSLPAGVENLNRKPSQLRQETDQGAELRSALLDQQLERLTPPGSNIISAIDGLATDSIASSATSQPCVEWSSNESGQPVDISDLPERDVVDQVYNPVMALPVYSAAASPTVSSGVGDSSMNASTNNCVTSGATDSSSNVDANDSRHHRFHNLYSPAASLRNVISGNNLRSNKHKGDDNGPDSVDSSGSTHLDISPSLRDDHELSSSSTMLKQTLLRHHHPQSTSSSNNSSASPSCPGSPIHGTGQPTGLIQSQHHLTNNQFHTDSSTSLVAFSTSSSTSSSSVLAGATSVPVKETHHISIDYDPVSGRKKLNTYEIIRELGRGQHGKVKLGKKIETGEYVAIKIVDRNGRPRLGKAARPGSTQEDKIRREIAILKKCYHPNIVQLLEVLDDNSSKKIYLVLEYLEKGEIEWQYEPGDPPVMPRHLVKSIARDVLLGLEYLHFQGIIHRDIKPANLLLSRDGVVKISDFGVSYISDYSQDELELAKTAGTPAFFAPELCAEKSETSPPITHMIDIWAFGVTLYCLLFGRVPFIADSEYELFGVILESPLVFPDEEVDGSKSHHGALSPAKLDSDMELAKDLLRQILEKDPSKRLDIPQIKLHPWICEGMEPAAQEKFLHQCDFENQRIEVTGEEMQEAVRGITGKIRRGLARLGSNALEFAAGLRRKPSGSSVSSREPTPVGAHRSSLKPSRARGISDSSGTTPPQRSFFSAANSPVLEKNPDERRASYASAFSVSTTGSTVGGGAASSVDKFIPPVAPQTTKPTMSSSRSNLNLNALLEGREDTMLLKDCFESDELKLDAKSTPAALSSIYPPVDFIGDVEDVDDYEDDEDEEEDDDDDDGELTLTVGPNRRFLSSDVLTRRRAPSAHIPASDRVSSEETPRYRSRSVSIDTFGEETN
ncbi:serine/threonine protein kinase SAK1 [Sugiyamaella lignohabitans]|uniref:non-specific serine/threonine protein kinase n=1 Tax=Sugiyamaella lignohabitans TaxID=796027 RepID=A0A167FVJ4_9ASCO|nr:serine/threonine protein kinase SAK1 [Sugiyamaella lignohabitans]ANB15753.1 serine/threonine protein kinase SAK1 [Sugiyamaella lignohabitans]